MLNNTVNIFNLKFLILSETNPYLARIHIKIMHLAELVIIVVLYSKQLMINIPMYVVVFETLVLPVIILVLAEIILVSYSTALYVVLIEALVLPAIILVSYSIQSFINIVRYGIHLEPLGFSVIILFLYSIQPFINIVRYGIHLESLGFSGIKGVILAIYRLRGDYLLTIRWKNLQVL